MRPTCVRAAATVLLSAGVLTSCLGSARVRPEARARIRSVRVLPLEVPPSTVTPALLQALAGSAPPATAPAGGGAGALATVAVAYALAVRWPEAAEDRRSAIAHFEAWARSGDSWSPDRALAAEAGRLLDSLAAIASITSEAPLPLPGVSSREPTWHMENWMRPRRAWFRREAPLVGPESRGSADALLEVSAGPLEYGSPADFLQVAVKLFDARTGALLGKRNCVGTARTESAKLLFADHGALFKARYALLARSALAECLTGVGLGTRRQPDQSR